MTGSKMALPIGESSVPLRILMAEDDPDDRLLLEQAFKDVGLPGDLRFVEDGEDLMRYLHRRGDYADSTMFPRPTVILLDLNMPKKDGRQALAEIKADPDLREIPIIVWTTSDLDEDKKRCQETGADTYITKPMSYKGLLATVRDLCKKWGSAV
jgi:CheY-like chemotaxis protein